jgi:hypothetical protein
MLDDLHDTAARLLPQGAALRRLARQAMEEAEGLHGRAVEQSRETFNRAYEGHFLVLMAAFDASAKRTAQAVEAALAAAEGRTSALEAGAVDAAPIDMARRTVLLELRDTLRRLGECVPSSKD